MIIDKNSYFSKKKEFESEIIYHSKEIFCKINYLVKKGNKKALIWIHGYNDYFYHYHISDLLIKKKYDIYTLDLQNYCQTNINKDYLYHIKDLKNYYKDIDSTFNNLKKDYDKIYLYGHSTGSLISSLYCYDGFYREKITGLILNSPFFDFNECFIKNIILKNLIYYIGVYYPTFQIIKENENKINNNSIDILKRFYFEPEYKLCHNGPVTAGWVKTIIDYQKFIKDKNLDIKIPILCLYSSKNVINNSIEKGDDILNINDISKYVDNLGKNVTEVIIVNAVHDIFTSDKKPLDFAIKILLEWLDKN